VFSIAKKGKGKSCACREGTKSLFVMTGVLKGSKSKTMMLPSACQKLEYECILRVRSLVPGGEKQQMVL